MSSSPYANSALAGQGSSAASASLFSPGRRSSSEELSRTVDRSWTLVPAARLSCAARLASLCGSDCVSNSAVRPSGPRPGTASRALQQGPPAAAGGWASYCQSELAARLRCTYARVRSNVQHARRRPMAMGQLGQTGNRLKINMSARTATPRAPARGAPRPRDRAESRSKYEVQLR